MTVFLWALIAMSALSAAGQLIWLVRGEVVQKSPAMVAVDLALNVMLIVWAAVLLA